MAAVAGEAVWAGLYVGLGFGFAGNIEAASSMPVSIFGLVGAGAVTLGLGIWVAKLLQAQKTSEP